MLDTPSTQRYHCVMIPALIDNGGPWKVLPPGIHDATLDEAESRFAITDHRKALFDGFRQAVRVLQHAGCSTVYLDGSFVTDKPTPGDFDACWDDTGVNASRLDGVLLDFTNKRQAQRRKYLGELFPVRSSSSTGLGFIHFFQTDKYTGKAKGVLRIRL